MTPIEALQNAIQECVEVDSHGELSFKAGDVSNLIKASGFKLVLTEPSDADVERVARAICNRNDDPDELWIDSGEKIPKPMWVSFTDEARAAIAAYVGGE